MADKAVDFVAISHDSVVMNHSAIIEFLGGASKVSAALGIKSANTVTYWKRRGIIPPLYWADIARLTNCTDNIVTVDDLKASSVRRRIAA